MQMCNFLDRIYKNIVHNEQKASCNYSIINLVLLNDYKDPIIYFDLLIS